MSLQSYIGAYHGRVAQHPSNPSLQNQQKSASASHKKAIFQPGDLNLKALQAPPKSPPRSKITQNHRHLQSPRNVSALTLALEGSPAVTTTAAIWKCMISSVAALSSSSYDKEDQLVCQSDETNVSKESTECSNEERHEKLWTFEMAGIEAIIELEFLKKASRARDRKLQASRDLADKRKVHRKTNWQYRALVLANKQPPVVGFQVPNQPVPNGTSSGDGASTKQAQQGKGITGSQEAHGSEENRNSNIPLFRRTPAKSGPPPTSSNKEKGLVDAPIATRLSTPLQEAVLDHTCWTEIARARNCPTIDIEKAMDSGWFGTACVNSKKYKLEDAKEGSFISRCTSKLGYWIKKATPKQLEFFNEALL